MSDARSDTSSEPVASDALAAEFEALRPQLTRVAYGILGSVAEAEDIVQEAWLRLGRTDATEIEDLRAWLTTVVSQARRSSIVARSARPSRSQASWTMSSASARLPSIP